MIIIGINLKKIKIFTFDFFDIQNKHGIVLPNRTGYPLASRHRKELVPLQAFARSPFSDLLDFAFFKECGPIKSQGFPLFLGVSILAQVLVLLFLLLLLLLLVGSLFGVNSLLCNPLLQFPFLSNFVSYLDFLEEGHQWKVLEQVAGLFCRIHLHSLLPIPFHQLSCLLHRTQDHQLQKQIVAKQGVANGLVVSKVPIHPLVKEALAWKQLQ